MADGLLINIQKFCVNDGPGIRTTVFLKGCPLNCLWCHNPESKSAAPELFYDPQKCVGCRMCEPLCPLGCHSFSQGVHLVDRKRCTACGRCGKMCPTGALEPVGYRADVADVMEEVLADRIFYEKSGGGMTLSGGEPMDQFAFTYALLKAAKKAGIHTCLETCGFAGGEQFRKIAAYVDIFLFDCKETDPDRHRAYTGVSNAPILRNLALLDALGANLILRCPVIPGCNDRPDHFQGIAALANRLRQIQRIELEPYHPLGAGKAARLGKPYELAAASPGEDTVREWIDAVSACTSVPVRRA